MSDYARDKTPTTAPANELHRPGALEGFEYLLRPRIGEGETRPLLLLHGTGGDESDLLPFGDAIAPGALLISPRGRAPEGHLNRWFARHAPGVLDEDDIRRRAEELRAFLAAVAQRHAIPFGSEAGERLSPGDVKEQIETVFDAAGFSNGANMLAALLLLHPGSVKNAVLMRPMLPLKPGTTPNLSGTAVLVMAGRKDQMIPQASTEELITLLTNAGAEVTTNWFDSGHRFTPEEMPVARKWLTSRRGPAR